MFLSSWMEIIDLVPDFEIGEILKRFYFAIHTTHKRELLCVQQWEESIWSCKFKSAMSSDLLRRLECRYDKDYLLSVQWPL